VKIRKTAVYDEWYKKLKDKQAKVLISLRIGRLEDGNPGDVKPIGGGLSEMRIDYGPGYRVYYKDTGKEIVILLCGGNKSTQPAYIKKANQIAALLIE
jgi:putative addiction module killer protein